MIWYDINYNLLLQSCESADVHHEVTPWLERIAQSYIKSKRDAQNL